ncbi:PAAR domain-containing protein [Paraburkholderia dioscoreae]|uniref:PAAR domain-containing protein n=1 Tax=Paraburkholderia dioscoreae TaxID=2604047 RepID=UPI0013EAAF75|nr:PAAR domain-containing protein [Paraburkholderia dioscoreae]
MFDRLVADGDRTTTGGEVIARSSQYDEAGRMYARGENKATCGNCDGAWPIAGSARDWMDDGFPMVKDLDWVLCPCRNNRVLAAASSTAFHSEGRQSEKPAARPAKAPVYDQQYTLSDAEGKPFANTRYRVRSGSVVIASGVTDSHGMTQRISTDESKRLCLEITH